MNELYVEQLVPKKAAGTAAIVKNISMIFTVLTFAATFAVAFIFIIPAIISVVVLMVSMRQCDLEFEYMYLSGELDIDKIIAKQKRKHKLTVNMGDVIVVAPTNSPEVRPFQNVKVTDYSTGIQSDSVYMMIYNKDAQNYAILIEPNQTLLNGMKMTAPRKVFI